MIVRKCLSKFNILCLSGAWVTFQCMTPAYNQFKKVIHFKVQFHFVQKNICDSSQISMELNVIELLEDKKFHSKFFATEYQNYKRLKLDMTSWYCYCHDMEPIIDEIFEKKNTYKIMFNANLNITNNYYYNIFLLLFWKKVSFHRNYLKFERE